MNKGMEKTETAWRVKPACWLLASLAVAVALAGLILIIVPGHRNGTATVLTAVSSALTIGLCALLQHQYDKRIDRAWSVIYGRLLRGLMFYALFVAAATFAYAAMDSQSAMIPLTIFNALADAALAATMVFLITDVLRNRGGATLTWVWMALLLGLAVFALCFLDVNWLAWIVIAVLAAVAVALSACKLRLHNNLCNCIFALAMAILAVISLFDGYVFKTQMILHIVRLILTPIYAFAAFLVDRANYARLANASESRGMRNGKTVIFRHTPENTGNDANAGLSTAGEEGAGQISGSEAAVQEQGSDALRSADIPQTINDAEPTVLGESASPRAVDKESSFRTQKCAKETTETTLKANSATGESEAVPCDRPVAELNCDTALKKEYRQLSLKYLSLAPLDAFSDITKEQLACMDALSVHTILQLAKSPVCRMAENIVRMASCEEVTAGD